MHWNQTGVPSNSVVKLYGVRYPPEEDAKPSTPGLLRELKANTNSAIKSLSFSPDGKYLAGATDENSITIWNVASGETIWHMDDAHDDVVRSVSFCPNLSSRSTSHTSILASGGSDDVIKLWEIDDEFVEQLNLFEQNATVFCLAWSNNGQYLLAGSNDGTLKYWNTIHGLVDQNFRGHTQTINFVDISKNDLYAASASDDATVRLWSTRTAQCLQTFGGHTGWVLTVRFAPHRNYLISTGRDRSVQLSYFLESVPSQKSTLLEDGHIGAVNGSAFTEDGRLLITGGLDDLIYIWDMTTKKHVLNINLFEKIEAIACWTRSSL